MQRSSSLVSDDQWPNLSLEPLLFKPCSFKYQTLSTRCCPNEMRPVMKYKYSSFLSKPIQPNTAAMADIELSSSVAGALADFLAKNRCFCTTSIKESLQHQHYKETSPDIVKRQCSYKLPTCLPCLQPR